jgi:hypothetical protein
MSNDPQDCDDSDDNYNGEPDDLYSHYDDVDEWDFDWHNEPWACPYCGIAAEICDGTCREGNP